MLGVGESTAFAVPEPGLGNLFTTPPNYSKEEPNPMLCPSHLTPAPQGHLGILPTLGFMMQPDNCFYQLSQSTSTKYTGVSAYLPTPLESSWTVYVEQPGPQRPIFYCPRNTWKADNKQSCLSWVMAHPQRLLFLSSLVHRSHPRDSKWSWTSFHSP